MVLGRLKIVGLAFLLGGFLGSCAVLEEGFYRDDFSWVPSQTKEMSYFLYDPGGMPFCSPESASFFAYIFENGDVAYYGSPPELSSTGKIICGGPVRTGWHWTNLGPDAFPRLLEILDQHRFDEFAPDYSYGFEACGDPSTTDVGDLRLHLKTPKLEKRIYFDNGCINSKDWGTIRHLWRSIRQFMALEDWVGKDAYTWDYDSEFENVILREKEE